MLKEAVYMFEKEKEGLIEVQNVYEIAPEDGTIIGMATEEEMEIAAELELQYYAHSRLLEANIQLDGSSYKELLPGVPGVRKKINELFGERYINV